MTIWLGILSSKRSNWILPAHSPDSRVHTSVATAIPMAHDYDRAAPKDDGIT